MSNWWFQTIILEVALLSAVIAGLIQFKELDKASKILLLLLSTNLIIETTAAWCALQFHQNNIIYNLYNPIQLLITSLYFETIIADFQKKRVGLLFPIGLTIIAIINILFCQSLLILNTNILAIMSLIIVGMCLYYYYYFLKKDTYLKKPPIHFWFTSVLLIYWSFTLFHWVVGLNIMYSKTALSSWTTYIIYSIAVLSYLTFALLFYNYNKFEPSGNN